MISNSWLRKWLTSRDVWIAFDVETKRVSSVTISPIRVHSPGWVCSTKSSRLKTITTFCSLFSRENTKWDLLNHTLMCVNASAFSEIITVWKLLSMQTSCYKGTPRKKNKNKLLPIFSRWMQNWEWSLMRKRFCIAFEENRLGKEFGTKFVRSKLLCAWTYQ